MKSLFLKFCLYCATCTAEAAIPDISATSKKFDIRQVQRAYIQRTHNGAVENIITIATTDPNLLATWTGLAAQTDGSRVQATPIFAEPENEPGDNITYGGGNATPDGGEIVMGENAGPFTGAFLSLEPKITKQLKKYARCEGNLAVVLVSNCNTIYGIGDDPDSPTTFKGIPITSGSFFVKSRKIGGLEEPDKVFFGWQFPPGWDEDLVAITPLFDAKSSVI